MPRITDRKKCLKYLTQPKLYWGLFTDLLILPLAGLMIIMTAFTRRFNIDTDNWFEHDYRKPPMLLIHGSSSSALQWLITRILYLRQHYNTYTIDFPQTTTTSIKEITAKVIEKANQIQCNYMEYVRSHPELHMRHCWINGSIAQCNLTIVGMSMGGLIAADFAENDFQGPNINRVITINSPLQGAPGLEFLDMNTIRHLEMTPKSDFLKQFHESIGSIADNRYLFVASHYDYQVPYNHAILYESDYKHFSKHNRILEHTHGHTAVILSPKIWKQIRDVELGLYMSVYEFLDYTTENFDKSHDAAHAKAVYSNAIRIVNDLIKRNPDMKDEFDGHLFQFCALFHDVIDAKYIKLGKSITREHLAKYVDFHLGHESRDTFFDVIDNISYSKQKSGTTKVIDGINRLYQIAVSDADKLEALGETGIQRCYEFEKVLNPSSDEKTITAKVVEHCHDKLLGLHKYIESNLGRRLAEPLTKHIEDFVAKNDKKRKEMPESQN